MAESKEEKRLKGTSGFVKSSEQVDFLPGKKLILNCLMAKDPGQLSAKYMREKGLLV